MPKSLIPRPPRANNDGSRDPFELTKWFDSIWLSLGRVAGFSWDAINFKGSLLSDIETRRHDDLQGLQQADDTSTATAGEKHVTDLLAHDWSLNKCDPVNVTADATAAAGQHLSVTCSSVDITITLPDAATNAGMPIWIHKADATAYEVLTSVKDIKSQGSTMHLISNGTDWVIS